MILDQSELAQVLVAPALTIERLLDTAMALVGSGLDAERCSLMLLLPETGELVIDKARGLAESVVSCARVKLGEGVAGWVARNRTPILADSAHAFPELERRYCASYATQSFVSVPIVAKEDLVGVLNAADKRNGGAFSVLDLANMEQFALLVAELVDVRAALEAIEQKSPVDLLTGFGNRQYFGTRLAQEMARARRYDQQLTLLLVEIDHGNELASSLGSEFSDELALTVGNRLQRAIRRCDVIMRYGPHAFALILPQTGDGVAERAAERLIDEVNTQPLTERADLSPAPALRIGISSYPSLALDSEQLINQAQAALDLAKTRPAQPISIWRQLTDQLDEAQRLGVPYLVDPSEMITADLAQLVPLDFARRRCCVPVGYERGKLTVAVVDATDGYLLSELATVTHLSIHPVISGQATIMMALNRMSELLRKPAAADVVIRKTPGRGRELKIVLKPLSSEASLANLMGQVADACGAPGVRIKTLDTCAIVASASALGCSRLLKTLRRIDGLLIESIKAEDNERNQPGDE